MTTTITDNDQAMQLWGWMRTRDADRARPWVCRVHDHSNDDGWEPVYRPA